MFKYLAVSLLTGAFLFGFLLQAGAFSVQRSILSDPNTAYPRIDEEVPVSTFDGNNNAAVYRDALDGHTDSYFTNFWQ